MAAIGMNEDKWYFTKEQLEHTPSRRAGIPADKELSYRQQAATLIQDMGQRLSVSQLTINTSIVYMHRFYMFYPFTRFHRHAMAPCCLFLAAKVEEQPRKLEHVIRVAHACLHRGAPPLDTNSEEYLQQAQDLIENESILLQSLGFEVTVHHPHTYVVKAIQLVRASKDLGQASYFMATNSLHLTTLCLQYKPTVVACACIHLACKWCSYEIPPSNDNKHWWEYMHADVTRELLDDIAQEFINIIEKCPSKLKRKINSITIGSNTVIPRPLRTNDGPTGLSKSHDNNDSNNDSMINEISKKFTGKDVTKNDKLTREIKKDKQEDNNHLEVNSTITSEGASVATSTTVVTLPVLPPLTTKYAAAAATTASQTKPEVSTTSTQRSSSNTTVSSGSKHKHRSHEEGTPSKKHKSSHHSSRSHSVHKRTSSSHSSDSSSPGIKHHGKPSHSSSHKKHHHSISHKSHQSQHKLIPPSPTLGLLDKSRLSSKPPVPPAEKNVLPPPPPPPPPPPSDVQPMYLGGYPGFNAGGRQNSLPPPPPPEPEPKSPPPPPPPPF